MAAAPKLRLGTSSWSCKDWVGKFYPEGTKTPDFISEYATRYSTVEIDSTFYGVPRTSTVEAWREKTPNGFLFSAKAPKLITHDLFLEHCENEVGNFIETMSILRDRLGPLLFQFPYYAKRSGVTEDDFLMRLGPFLKTLPKGEFRFAVEVRNKTWINERLFDTLHAHNITLALIDHPWMARPGQLFRHRNIMTGGFAYFRWLGDRHGIEKRTTTWNEIIVERETDLEEWTPPIKKLLDQQMDVFGYVNNHYAGYAPDNVEQLKKLLS